MAELDINSATTTDLTGNVQDFSVGSKIPDSGTYWDYPNSAEYLGYYKSIPELKSALHVLAQRVAGSGWDALSARHSVILEGITGWGEDTFASICMNLIIQKKIFGDAYAEIIRNDEGTLINLKPLYTGDMRVVVNEQGLIDGYEQRSHAKNGKVKKFEPYRILHLVNDRISNEMHGTSVIESLKMIIDAKNEALADERKIRHRELALGVLYVDTDDTTKLNNIKTQYANAIKNGEVLVLPQDVAKLEDNANKGPRDRIQWLQYLDNLFYQVVGTPKVLVTSEGYTEAGGKAGLLAFEPTEISEKLELEGDIWNQLAIRIKFKRTPSLLGEAIGTEQKNAGQTGIQQNETKVSATRTE